MVVTISRWGNSLAVRLPRDTLEKAGLVEGDVLEISADGAVITLARHDVPVTLDELIGRITPENLHSALFDTPVGAES